MVMKRFTFAFLFSAIIGLLNAQGLPAQVQEKTPLSQSKESNQELPIGDNTLPLLIPNFQAGMLSLRRLWGTLFFLGLTSGIPARNGFIGVLALTILPEKNGFLKLPNPMF
jgi:hypothetical protein